MAATPALTSEELDALRKFDTCIVANAIETFHVRFRNTRFTDGKTRCMFPEAPTMVGYAVTGRLGSGESPIADDSFHDRGDLWTSHPRISRSSNLVAAGYWRKTWAR